MPLRNWQSRGKYTIFSVWQNRNTLADNKVCEGDQDGRGKCRHVNYTSEHVSNARIHGGIGNGYRVGRYGIDITDPRNHQQQFKMTSNNDMDVDTNCTRRTATKRKKPDNGLTDEIVKKAKHHFKLHRSSMQQSEERRLMKSHLKTCGEKNASSTAILCTNKPTIVVTPINSKELKSAISVINFIGLRKRDIGRLWYQIQEVKRLHKMPIVRVLLYMAEDVVKILIERQRYSDWIFNGKSRAIDKVKSRPKSCECTKKHK
ncbi:hypothetical protein RFI_01989, partial [Reticulomyxa filosa]